MRLCELSVLFQNTINQKISKQQQKTQVIISHLVSLTRYDATIKCQYIVLYLYIVSSIFMYIDVSKLETVYVTNLSNVGNLI